MINMFGSFLRWPWSLPLQVYLLEGADAVMESQRRRSALRLLRIGRGLRWLESAPLKRAVLWMAAGLKGATWITA